MEEQSLEHTRWNCKYHIVLPPSSDVRQFMANIEKRQVRFYENCVNINGLGYWKRMRVLIIYMCIKIPPKYSVSQIMDYLKGKSSLMKFEQFSNLKYKFGNRHFWCKGYFVSTAGVNETTIIKYSREQETRDKIADQHTSDRA